MARVSLIENEAGGCCGVRDGVDHFLRSECGGSGGVDDGFDAEMYRGVCGCMCQEGEGSQGGPQDAVPAVGAYRFEIDAERLWKEWRGGAELWRLRDERRAFLDARSSGGSQRRLGQWIPIHGESGRERICVLQI